MKMNKSFLLFLVVVLFSFGTVCTGQINIDKTIRLGASFDDNPINVFFGHENDIVITGYKKNSNGNSKPFIFLLDSMGSIKNCENFDSVQFHQFSLISGFEIADGYLFAGIKSKEIPTFNQSLYLYHTTHQLSVIDAYLVNFSDSLDIGGLNIKKYDSTLIWHGYGYVYDTFKMYPFIIKTDLKGNILNQHIGDYQNYQGGINLNYALVQDFDNNGYLLFDFQHIPKSDFYAVNIDSNLNLDTSGHIKLADSIMINNIQTGMHQIYEAKHFNNKLVYFGRGGIAPEDFYIAITDSQSITTHYKGFNGDDGFYLHANKPLAKKGNNIFVSFADSIDKFKHRFNTFTNKITVARLDTVLNIVWQKRLGWDAYFFQQDIIATADGGCLVMGSVYDADTMSQQHDIVLYKLDSNGNVTGTHRIEDAGGQSLKTYPNPGEDYFNLDMPIGKGTLRVFNQNGKLLFEQSLTKGRNKIDMKPYASGIYYLRLLNEQNRNVGAGKWIKR